MVSEGRKLSKDEEGLVSSEFRILLWGYTFKTGDYYTAYVFRRLLRRS
jgi:hypothetical protein